MRIGWLLPLATLGALAACHDPKPAERPPIVVAPAPVAEGTVQPPPPPPPEVKKPEPVSEEAMESDGHRANDFAMQLLATTKRKRENVLLCPASVRDVLTLLALGARGETEKEFQKTLRYGKGPLALANADQALWEAQHVTFTTRAWADRALPLEPAFASLSQVEFAKSEEARRTINDWVSEQTKTKIPELLPQGALTAQTRLVVTNAVWFKAAWATPFAKDATRQEPWGTGKTASMMHASGHFFIFLGHNGKLLELPYADSTLAMDILLPDAKDGAYDVYEALREAWAHGLQPRLANISVPRFSFASGGELGAALKGLGIRRAFTPAAEFDGLSSAKPLFLSEVFQRAWISVDEAGTEAAAATGAVVSTTSVSTEKPIEFKVDRPFLIFIRDTKSDRVLFAGRVFDVKS